MSLTSPYTLAMKDYLPEWDDSDTEGDSSHRDPTFTPGPAGQQSARHSTPQEMEVHPYPTSSENKPQSGGKFQNQQPLAHSSTPKVKSTSRSKPGRTEAQLQNPYAHKFSQPMNSAHGNIHINYKGNAHENEILMLREKLLQSVETVKCMQETLDSVSDYISTERTIDEKILLRLLHPMKTHFGTNFTMNPALPSEVHVLNQMFSLLEETINALLTNFVGCVSSRSKIYVSQIKRMREVSNTACRNALQAERAELNGQIIRLKKHHMHVLQEQATSKMQELEEKDKVIHHLTTKLSELESQKVLFDDREVAMEVLRSEVQARVSSAVDTALREAENKFNNQRADLVESYENKLQKQEAAAEKRMEEAEFNFNEKISVQAAHHEQLYNILAEEKERYHQETNSLRTELQQQAMRFSNEKMQYIEEFNAEQRRCEQEADTRVAEQIKAISAVKAEAAAKVRQMQERERIYMDEVNAQRLKEKDDMESNLASEIDNATAQHRRALQQLRAQLDVKHSDEISRVKRNHETVRVRLLTESANEVRRLVLENERLKKLVIRRGIGAGQDGIELELEEPPLLDTSRRTVSHAQRYSKPSLATSFAQYLERQCSPATGEKHESSPLPKMTYSEPSIGSPSRLEHRRDNRNTNHHSSPNRSQESRLQWGALRESLTQQEEQSEVVSPIPKDGNNSYESILETSPSGRLKFSQPIRGDEMIQRRAHAPPPPPPPPPDTYLVDEAYEASRERGKGKSSVASNATNIGKYMSQLQKYLEGDAGLEDTTFNSNSTGGDDSSSGVANARTSRYSAHLYESSIDDDDDDDSDAVDSLNNGD